MRPLVILTALAVVSAPLPGSGMVRGEPAAPARPILVIVPTSSTLDNVSLETLRRIFLGDVPELRPLNLPPASDERIGFDRAVLGLNAEEAARFWIDRKIRGQRGAARVIPSGRLMGRIVARVPGSIGYLVEGPLPPGVKVLRIGGLPPGHPRYPLLVTQAAR
jgi:hypothetical protein